jgi:hypothetical protein
MRTKPVQCPVCGKAMRRHKRKTGDYRIYVCVHGCKGVDGKCLEIFVLDSGKDYSCPWFNLCARMWLLNCKECRGE